MNSIVTPVYRQRQLRRTWPLAALTIGSVFEYRLGRAPSITVVELICLAVGLQMLADWVIGGRELEERVSSGLQQLRAAFFFACWMFVCAFAAIATRSNALNLWLVRDHFPVFLMLFVLAFYGITYSQIETILKLYLLAAFAMIALGAVQAITGGPQVVSANWANDAKMDINGQIIMGANKARGFFTHPNGLASFFIFPVAMMFLTLRRNNVFSLKWIFSAVAVSITLAVFYATYAKGALAWAAIVVAVIFVMPRAADRWRWLPLLAMTVASLALLFGSLYLFENGHRSFATILTRVRLWQAAWSISTHDFYVWFFGNGQLMMPETSWRFSDIAYSNAHSGLVNIPLQYGIPGLVVFLWMCISAYASAAVGLSDKRTKNVSWMMMTLLSAYFWNALFEPHLEGGGNLLQFGVCVALCYAIRIATKADAAVHR